MKKILISAVALLVMGGIGLSLSASSAKAANTYIIEKELCWNPHRFITLCSPGGTSNCNSEICYLWP